MNKKEPLQPYLKVLDRCRGKGISGKILHVFKEERIIRIKLINSPFIYVFLLKKDFFVGSGNQYAFFASLEPTISYKEVIKALNYPHLMNNFKTGDIGEFLDEYKDKIPKIVLDQFLFNLEVFR